MNIRIFREYRWEAVTVLLCLLLAPCLPAQTAPAKYPAYKAQLEELQAAWKKRDFAAAEPIAQAFLAEAKRAQDRDAEAEALRMFGAHYQLQADFGHARQYYEQSLTIRRELGKEQDLLQMNSGLGFVCLTLKDYPAAEKYLAEARTLAQKLGNKAVLAQATQLTGLVWQAQGKRSDAADALKRALAIYQELKNKAGIAAVLLAQGKLALEGAEYGDVFRDSFAALNLFRELKRPADEAKCLDQIGTAFHQLEQPKKALEYYRQSLELQEKTEAPAVLAASYERIGVELSKLGEHTEAVENFQKALAIWGKGQNHTQTASARINLGVELQTSDRAAARENLQAALAICRRERCLQGDEATALYNLGNLSLAEGKLPEALRDHQQALRLRRKAMDRLGSLRSMNRVAVTLEAQGQWQQAAAVHQRAMAEFESLWAKVTDPVQAAGFRDTSAILYPHYSATLLRLGKRWRAFRVAERGRGTALARATQSGSRSILDLIGAEDRATWKTLSAKEAQARNHLRVAREAADEDATAAAEADYLDASQQMSQLRDRAIASHSELAGEAAASPATIAELSALADRNPDTLYLEWVIVDERQTLLFALSHQRGLQTFRIVSANDRLDRLLTEWYRSMESGIGARGFRQVRTEKPADESQTARALYKAVFGTAAPLFEQGPWKRMVTVGYGPLLRVPFPALIDGSGRRLVERLSISGAVSLTGLVRASPPRPTAMEIYAVGDPLRDGEQRLVVPQNVKLSPLHAARSEAEAVAGLTRGGTAVLGEAARESRVKREMVKYGVLHFATHGLLDSENPLQSSLLLATEPEDSEEDGLLEAWEIAGLPLSARLAVLSACETGQGEETLGDGILGLSWAFQAAGCPNVVASLWSVNDAATRTLMIAFYRELRAGKRIDEALRTAMLAVKANREFSAPFYWSAFQAIGPAGTLWSNEPALTHD